MTAMQAPRAAIGFRDYQAAARAAVRDAVMRGERRVLIVLPTGGGKTVVFCSLSEALGLCEAEKVLILVHRDELVKQAVDKYTRIAPGEMIGVEKASSRAGGMDRIAVASVQTLQGPRVDDFLSRFGRPALVITDEAHHAASQSYVSVYNAIGIRRGGDILHVGVTATPKRGDGVALLSIFDEISYSISIEELIARGYLVDIRAYRVETATSLAGIKKVGGDFNEKQLQEALDNDDRNMRIVRAYLDLAPGKKSILFAAGIEHSKSMVEAFEAAGITARHVDGGSPDRAEILAAFGRGEFRVLCNAQVLTEGYDEPTIECVIMARPTTKQGFLSQCIGRGTRLLDEVAAQHRPDMTDVERCAVRDRSTKAACIVIDVADVSRGQSLASIPALMGLPPSFDLGGRSATDVARRYNKIVDESGGIAANLIENVEMLEAVEAVDASERLSVLIGKLLAADRKQKYIPLDLLRPKPLPAWARESTSMTWFATGENSFRLNLDGEVVTVEQNQLGRFDVVARKARGRGRMTLGSPETAREAFALADGWIKDQRAALVPFIDSSAEWRTRPASPVQKKILKRSGVKVSDVSTRGEANDVLRQLRHAVAS